MDCESGWGLFPGGIFGELLTGCGGTDRRWCVIGFPGIAGPLILPRVRRSSSAFEAEETPLAGDGIASRSTVIEGCSPNGENFRDHVGGDIPEIVEQLLSFERVCVAQFGSDQGLGRLIEACQIFAEFGILAIPRGFPGP